MEKQLNSKEAKALFQAIAELKTAEAVKSFLRDVCTISELESMIERLEVARLVMQNVPYREISKQTGASTATVTRVAHWVHHGMGGYRLALE